MNKLNAVMITEPLSNSTFTLATMYHKKWTCRLCDFTETSRIRMLHHCRFEHITLESIADEYVEG